MGDKSHTNRLESICTERLRDMYRIYLWNKKIRPLATLSKIGSIEDICGQERDDHAS